MQRGEFNRKKLYGLILKSRNKKYKNWSTRHVLQLDLLATVNMAQIPVVSGSGGGADIAASRCCRCPSMCDSSKGFKQTIKHGLVLGLC